MRAGRGVGLGAVLLAMIAVVGAASCRAGQPFAAVAPARATTSAAANVATQVFNYDRFGAVTVYRGRGHPRDVVLFVSGDGGWDLGAASMAQRLADKGAMVAGIDGRHYRDQLEKASETCVSPSADFENLSHYLQSKWGLKKYLEPTLVGYATGATLVYATLAEAPEGLFKGALSIGFCPDLDLKKQLCKSLDLQSSPRLGSNGALQGVDFSPGRELPGQWISLQGELDRVCPASSVRKFTATVRGSEMVMLPGVGHDYAIDEKWLPQFEGAYARLAAIRPEAEISALPAAVADLPLIIVPAATAGIGDRRDWFGVFLTGDGGWVGLDKGVSAVLAKHNIPIVGWDSLKYFWSRRTPDGASRDLERVLRTYSRVWGRAHVLLIGYSQGADTLPFMVNRLPAATRELVGFTTLLGISDNAVWEFHVASWLGNPSKGVPTAPELARWSGSPYLCLYGESDGDAACAQLTGHDGDALRMPGGHHFGGQYAEIADEILSRLPQQ
jgi:type IV secretory pathway VirJ component